MTMVNKGHRVLTLFLAIFMMFSLIAPMSVFGVVGYSSKQNFEEIDVNTGKLSSAAITAAIADANKKSGHGRNYNGSCLVVKIDGEQYEFLKYDGVETIKINKDVWDDAGGTKISKVMQEFIDGLAKNGGDAEAIQTFMTTFSERDGSLGTTMLMVNFSTVKADLYKAYKIMEPFVGALNVVLGVGCVLLILILMASTVMDLAYIGLPVWREAQDGKGKKNPFGVSYEALRTVQEVEKGLGGGDGEYRNAYLLYFKRRALTYIILAICIMYLICGGISGIIGFVLSLVGGITG